MPLLREPDIDNVSGPRTRLLRRALRNTLFLREFMVHRRAADPMRDEEELWLLLSMEVNRVEPRYSFVRKIHGALTRVRQRREWAELSRLI